MNITFFNTYISPRAKLLVNDVLDSGMLSEGRVSQQFEEQLKSTFNLQNIICLNSGTSSLHLALDLLGVGPGDEVILPAQTFVASGLAILYCGAKPVFADIRYEDGNIDPKSVATKINSKTKAILCVHWGGYPCDMDALKALTKHTAIRIVEDAAHALGASYKGNPIGSISDITCFSFQAIKHLSTGDGGAICINDTDLFEKALRKKWFGIDRKHSEPTELGERLYNLEELGYKYHMNNYSAALGLANLEGYLLRLEKRRSIAAYYRSELSSLPGIQLFEEKEDRQSAYWLFGFHCAERETLIRKLKQLEIPSSVVHQRIDRNRIFSGPYKDLKEQERFDADQLHIPIHDAIDEEKAAYIVHSIKSSL